MRVITKKLQRSKSRRSGKSCQNYERMMKTLLLQNQQIIIQQQNMMFMVMKQFHNPSASAPEQASNSNSISSNLIPVTKSTGGLTQLHDLVQPNHFQQHGAQDATSVQHLSSQQQHVLQPLHATVSHTDLASRQTTSQAAAVISSSPHTATTTTVAVHHHQQQQQNIGANLMQDQHHQHQHHNNHDDNSVQHQHHQAQQQQQQSQLSFTHQQITGQQQQQQQQQQHLLHQLHHSQVHQQQGGSQSSQHESTGQSQQQQQQQQQQNQQQLQSVGTPAHIQVENIAAAYLTPVASEQDPNSEASKPDDDDISALLGGDDLLTSNLLYNPQTDIGQITPYKSQQSHQETPSYYSSGGESLTTPRVEQQQQPRPSTTANINQNVVKNLADSFKSPSKPKINVQILSGTATRNMKNNKARIIQSMNISEFLRHVHQDDQA